LRAIILIRSTNLEYELKTYIGMKHRTLNLFAITFVPRQTKALKGLPFTKEDEQAPIIRFAAKH
jgi:hypothetical protein